MTGRALLTMLIKHMNTGCKTAQRPRDLFINSSLFQRRSNLVLGETSVAFRSKRNTNQSLLKRSREIMEIKLHKENSNKRRKEIPVLQIHVDITVGELAEISHRSIDMVCEAIALVEGDQRVKRRKYPERMKLDLDLLPRIATRLGYRIKAISSKIKQAPASNKDILPDMPTLDPTLLKPRPPIVAVMGHVDHGKTTILDALRKTSVAAGEAGGITQSIGAFSVPLSTGQVTFIDTPGHSVFTTMRERGAKVTDIIVLVVAADDGVMEQTVESINMAKMAEASIVVALNKCDKKQAQPDLVVEELQDHGIKCEEIGGDVQAIRISALKNKGLDNLVKSIVTQSELLDLRADPEMQVQGMVIEARIRKGLGPMASVVVRQGTLTQGKCLIAGTSMAKVKRMLDSNGKVVSSAGPGMAVDIMGWRSLPLAGQMVLEAESEARAKQALKQREMELKMLESEEILQVVEGKREQERKEYDNLRSEVRNHTKRRERGFQILREKEKQIDDTPEMRILLKADVDGSMEALLNILNSYDSHEQCNLRLLHHGLGEVTQSELTMAEEFGATIFLFNSDLSVEARAQHCDKVPILKHNVIYHFVDDLICSIEEKLPPLEVPNLEGEANVLKVFQLKSNRIDIAGCAVQKGALKQPLDFRLLRNDEIIHEGPLKSLRQGEREIKEATKGMECGLLFDDSEEDFNVEVGDKIQCFSTVLRKNKLNWKPPGF